MLTCQGTGHEYHLEISKRVLVVHPDNIEDGNVFGTCHGFKVCTGVRCLGSYIEDDESKPDWLRERTLLWEKNISTISETAGKYTQDSYATVVRTIK